MILAIDVQYDANSALVAGVSFGSWTQSTADQEYLTSVVEVEGYQAGKFYKRELPCILSLLDEHRLSPDIIVVDGYVYLDGKSSSGLGKYLYDSLNGKVTVIGVAKKTFDNISDEYQVFRGTSKKPLYVTAEGMSTEDAKDNVRQMSGENRIPLLLKRADQLCRGLVEKL